MILTCYLRPFYTFTDRITDHPGSSLRDHPCYLRHYRVYTGEASGVILGVPAYPGKKLSLLNFSSRSSRMKQSVLFPVGTVYLRVAAEYIRDSPCRHREVRINTGFIRVWNSVYQMSAYKLKSTSTFRRYPNRQRTPPCKDRKST